MKTIHRNLSIFAGAVLFAAVTMTATPHLQAQANMQTQSSAATTPAQVVNQLLSMAESDIVPLAEAMPAEKYNFAPTSGNFKGVRTFAAQVNHITNANFYMFGSAASMKPTNMPNVKTLKTKDEMVQALKDSFAFAHRAIDTLNDKNVVEKIKPVDGIDTRVGVMLFAIIHMNDHYGQMVEYVRMNGIVPPASQPSGK